jgi:hypothetical protein
MRRSVTAPGVCPTLRRRERTPGSGCNGLRAAGHVRASVGPTRGKGRSCPASSWSLTPWSISQPYCQGEFRNRTSSRPSAPPRTTILRSASNHDRLTKLPIPWPAPLCSSDGVRRTPGISCERPIRSTLVSFIPLFDGSFALRLVGAATFDQAASGPPSDAPSQYDATKRANCLALVVPEHERQQRVPRCQRIGWWARKARTR